MTARLRIVPPAPAASGELEEMGKDEAVDWLRRMMNVSRELCDAVDRYIGPEQRPQLTVLPGGRAGDDQ